MKLKDIWVFFVIWSVLFSPLMAQTGGKGMTLSQIKYENQKTLILKFLNDFNGATVISLLEAAKNETESASFKWKIQKTLNNLRPYKMIRQMFLEDYLDIIGYFLITQKESVFFRGQNTKEFYSNFRRIFRGKNLEKFNKKCLTRWGKGVFSVRGLLSGM